MIRFIGKRILQMIPVVLLVATLIFGILYLVPGDPAQIMLGSTASEYELAEMREQLGLNRPFIVQLGEFLSDVFLHFDLGESYLTGAPVAGEIMQRLPRTLILGIASMVLAFGIGIPLGVTAAVHQNGWGDRISMIIALLGVSIPTFWLAMLFVLLLQDLIFIKTWLVPSKRNRRLGVLCASDSFTLFRWSCHSGTTGEIKYA